jgi:hypothetical protein
MAKKKKQIAGESELNSIRLSKMYPSSEANETKLKTYIEKNGTKR